ncbi:MAG TPA: helix-turn-helix domain-containing protein [Gaiellaceae bacterium]|nr:helix-turn-helix domain-containing protein [Gaiellaceae bacterium]
MQTATDPSQLAPLLTSKQLAVILRVPVNTLYAWQTRGTGPPAIRVGRHTRYRVEDVQSWLLERQAASP